MDDNPYSELKKSLTTISAKALNFSSRLKLANNLDSKQLLASDKGFARDYRGLAELIGFQYYEIKRFEEFKDRTMQILESWATRPDATLDKLISYLEDMDRYDIIEELIPSLEKDVENYLKYQKSLEIPIQVAEVSPGPMNPQFKSSALTRDDLRNGENTIYDAYVSYADADSHIAADFAHVLESPRVGLKLFIRGRDMLAGCAELDTNIELIKNRCRHMLIILTPNFIKSPALEFQVSFAGTLAIEQKQRILIPVILTPCEIPPILNSVSKIDFTKEYTHDWMWDKLITSLMPEDNMAIFLSSLGRNPVRHRSLSNSQGSVAVESRPVITFPETARYPLCITNDSGKVLSIARAADITYANNKDSVACSEIKDSAVCFETKDSIICSENKDSGISTEIKDQSLSPEITDPISPSKTGSSSKMLHQLKSLLKRKGHSTSTSSTSFSSGATSGFHSQSASNIKSLENSNGHYTGDTSL